MKSRPGLFLAIALVTTAVVMAAWVFMALTGGRGPGVPAGQTKTSGGVAWHLDWIELFDPDDPMFKESYFDVIDGAAYVVAQFTFEASEEVTICFAQIVGAGRQWTVHGVKPVSEATDRWCEPRTSGTIRVVAIVPPSAVAEIKGIDIYFGDRLVRLLGRVR